MARNVREILNDFMSGMEAVGQTNGKQVGAFMKLGAELGNPEIIDAKTTELISVGIAAYTRCEFCIVYHVYKSLEAGAKPEEIMEAAMVSVGFGGGPTMAYSVTLLRDSIEEFKNDFTNK